MGVRDGRWRWMSVVAWPLVLVLSGCNPFGCGSEWRFADYSGTLGDSTQAVVAGDVRTPGRVFVGLSQWRGTSEQQQINGSVTFVGYADAVQRIRLLSGPGATARVLDLPATEGYSVRDSVFNLYPVLVGNDRVWRDIWAGFEAGTGLVELVPVDSRQPTVRARMGRTNGRGWSATCT